MVHLSPPLSLPALPPGSGCSSHPCSEHSPGQQLSGQALTCCLHTPTLINILQHREREGVEPAVITQDLVHVSSYSIHSTFRCTRAQYLPLSIPATPSFSVSRGASHQLPVVADQISHQLYTSTYEMSTAFYRTTHKQHQHMYTHTNIFNTRVHNITFPTTL